MLIDCASCIKRDLECDNCVVTMILGPMPSSIDPHRPALDVLASAGLVAPLRLIKSEGQDGPAIAACQ